LVSNDRKGESLFVRQQSRSGASAARTTRLSVVARWPLSDDTIQWKGLVQEQTGRKVE
jgi:hypothetical protein